MAIRPGAALGGPRGQARGEIEIGLGAHVFVLAAAEERPQGSEKAGRVAQRPVLVQLELEEPFAHEYHDLGPRQDAHVGRQTKFERELTDQTVAEGMECRDRRVRVAVRDELIHARLHLVGGFVCERESQDLRRTGSPRGYQPRDPARDDLSLAGAGAGNDQQRTLAVTDGASLLGVEAGQ